MCKITLQNTFFQLPKISFCPTKKTRLTFTKAPMAHKTFSQEQFIFKFYKFKILFFLSFTEFHFLLNINKSIYLLLFLRNYLPVIETNLIFLKKINLKFFVSDPTFFKFSLLNFKFACMMKLVDMQGLKPCP